MKTKDVLFRETLVRIGPEQMIGVQRLIEEGHTGIAEKHTVAKLFTYVRQLESQLGISVPDADAAMLGKRYMKINTRAGSYYAPSASA